jgi:hypothetical protein
MTIIIDLLDDRTRPKAPRIDGATDAHRRHGRRLAMIHALHLQQMADVRAVMEQVEAGAQAGEDLGEAVNALQMSANYRVFGNLCGQECQMLTFHHTAEDRHVFPTLMQGDDGLRKVVERLAAEHEIIHRLLEHLEERAMAIISDPGGENFVRLKEIFELLEKVVKSHFGYEQAELEEAIGYWNVPL